jgi:Flp pilus assembly protein CpaB
MPVAAPLRAPRPRRRPGLLALGVALVAVGALAAAWLVSTSSAHIAVLVAARDVPYGTVLTDADLSSVEVAGTGGVAVIPAGERDQVVGRVAATTIVTGSLLAPAQLTAAAPPAPGEVLVGVPLKADRLPAGGLTPGDRILIVETPGADGDPPTGPPATLAATVVRVGPADLDGVSVLDVTVAAGDGPALAARAATGRIALVLLPRAAGS